MDRELKAFFERLNSEVLDRQTSSGAGATGGSPYSEEAFAEILLEYLSEIGVTENPELCYHEGAAGRANVKINGYAFSDENDRLDLFTGIRLEASAPAQIGKEDISRAAARAARFFEASLSGFHKRMEPSTDAAALAARIHKGADELELVRVFILTDGLSKTKKIPDQETGGVRVHFEIWDLERLFRGMQAGLPRDEIDIDFKERFGEALPCLPMPKPAQEYNAYLVVLSGEMLYDLYEEYGPRLLELNVRSFLSARGKVNSGIRKTLREEPDRFMAYNNGIVVTVDELQVETLQDGRPAIRCVKGLQIVNGGQTTASIHRARKTDKANVSRVLVPAKITVIQSDKLDEIVQMISHYANTQNTIQPADFSANDPYHVEIERLSKVIWCPDHHGRWFYERARGQYQVAKAKDATTRARARRFNEQMPSTRKFTKTDLAKYANAWDQKPHVVSFGAQKNFNHFMQNLRNGRSPDWLPDEHYYRNHIARAILLRATQKTVRKEKFPAHQANIIAYTVAYLSWRTGGNLDLEGIWQAQGISTELTELIRTWAHRIDDFLRESAGGRMVTEWAKKEACWDQCRNLDLPLPDPLPREMSERTVMKTSREGQETKVQETVSPDDYRNIEICKRLDGADWLKIHAWGKKTGRLQNWQAGIAQTLATYAASEWVRGPSPKQARHGAAMIKLAREAGILDPSEA